MKRTLLAIGIAVLVSMMVVPRAYCWVYGLHGCDAPGEWLPFFMNSPWGRVIHWGHFALQTAFAVIAAAVIVNLFPRRPRK